MKNLKLLLYLIAANLILSLPSYCQTDSYYPKYYKDPQGKKLIIITEQQQRFITYNLLELKKCKTLSKQQFNYIGVLENQIKDYKSVSNQKDSLKQQFSIMLNIKENKILNLNKQIEIQDRIIKDYKIRHKRQKKKILGWKVGTFTVIGFFAIALPTTIAIISQ